MYRCEDCGKLFVTPQYFKDEAEGVSWAGCPYCSGEPELLVVCSTCANEVPAATVSDDGLCRECQKEVLKRFQGYMSAFLPEERSYLNSVFDGEVF